MTYEAILKAAREQDKVALHAALSNCPIDIRKRGTCFLTAAGELARENETDSVHFLLSHGANETCAAYGAALCGNKVLAESLRARGASINLTARGAAQGGHREYAENLQAEGASIHYIAQGAAHGGHREYADFLKRQGADINWVVGGAAEGGHFEYVESLRAQGADINWIACGAAIGGHLKHAESLRAHGAHINYIAGGAAHGGHLDYAEFLRAQGADINHIAQGAASGGHREYVESLRAQGANLKSIIHGFIDSRRLRSEKNAFQLLVYINNDAFRNELIRALKNDNDLPQEIKDKLPHIQRRINHIYQLKNNYAIELHQAISIQQERTPTSFLLLQLLPQLLQERKTVKNDGTLPALNSTEALIIMSFICPLREIEIQHLNCQLARFYLQRSIARYYKAPNWFQKLFFTADQRKHKETAQDFQDDMSTQNRETFFKSCTNTIKKIKDNELDNNKQTSNDPFYKSLIRAKNRIT